MYKLQKFLADLWTTQAKNWFESDSNQPTYKKITELRFEVLS